MSGKKRFLIKVLLKQFINYFKTGFCIIILDKSKIKDSQEILSE